MTYIALLACALSIFVVWLVHRVCFSQRAEQATERLRDALKNSAEGTVRAILIADKKWP